MVVYDVSSIVSKNRNVSDGKLLPIDNFTSGLHWAKTAVYCHKTFFEPQWKNGKPIFEEIIFAAEIMLRNFVKR